MERLAYQALMPTKVIFGVGSIARTGDETAQLGTKALVVTGTSAMRSLGFTAVVEKSLSGKGIPYELFEEIETNPSTASVEEGVKTARDRGCDVVIGLGGGSAVDAAKAIASSAGLGIPVVDLMQNGMPRKGLPCLAIPTTAGTGAEVTHISVLTIRESKRKDALRSPHNFPTVAILDPALTLKLPPYITANTGVDALAHAMEAYTSRQAHPISDLYARKAMSLVNQYLRRAVLYGDDMEARTGMMLASNLAGMAIANAGTAAAHGMAMTIGGICNTDHGTTVGLALPAVLEYNLAANLEKHRDIASLLGENVEGMSLRQAAGMAAQAVRTLLNDVNLPLRLRDIGVTEETLPQLLADTKTQRAWLNNPRPVSPEDMERLLRKTF